METKNLDKKVMDDEKVLLEDIGDALEQFKSEYRDGIHKPDEDISFQLGGVLDGTLTIKAKFLNEKTPEDLLKLAKEVTQKLLNGKTDDDDDVEFGPGYVPPSIN